MSWWWMRKIVEKLTSQNVIYFKYIQMRYECNWTKACLGRTGLHKLFNFNLYSSSRRNKNTISHLTIIFGHYVHVLHSDLVKHNSPKEFHKNYLNIDPRELIINFIFFTLHSWLTFQSNSKIFGFIDCHIIVLLKVIHYYKHKYQN